MSDRGDLRPEEEVTRDERLENLLDTINIEVGTYANQLTSQIKRLAEIGIALSSEHNLEKLLETIVDETRRFTNADGGTLYILENEQLNFMILQNQSMDTRMGGTSGKKITFPPVILSKSNVSAFVAMTGETINIPDVYEAEGFDFTGPRKFDEATGYRTRSMLVVPMRNQDNDIIGVLQLINAQDPKNDTTIAFSPDFVKLTESLASQAAVAITNAKLIKDMEDLFDSFVKVMASAIDEKSPYTAGHIKRVAELGVFMCEVINETKEGPYADVQFNADQLKEMSIAGWMHDLGKITTPVHIVDKSTKLQTIYDRVGLLQNRFQLIESAEKTSWLERKVEMLKNGASEEEIVGEESKFQDEIEEIRSDLEFVVKTNTGGEFMDDSKIDRVKGIADKTFSLNGNTSKYLTDDEVENLCIRKGTLLASERQKMMDHAAITIKMLDQIPFTKKLKNVSRFAGGHHETLDGTGYPKKLKGDEITLEARILGLVDFYEALTSTDRPYKKEMPIEKAFAILGGEVERGKMDKDLFELFKSAKVHERYKAITEARKAKPPSPEPEKKAEEVKKVEEVKEAVAQKK